MNRLEKRVGKLEESFNPYLSADEIERGKRLIEAMRKGRERVKQYDPYHEFDDLPSDEELCPAITGVCNLEALERGRERAKQRLRNKQH